MFKKAGTPFFVYIFIFLIIVFLLGLTGLFKFPRRIAEKLIVVPIKQKIFDFQRTKKNDLSGCELKNQGEIDSLKVKISTLIEENKEQKRLLSAPLPKNWQFMSAKVIFYENESIDIDKGTIDGIKEGMIAITEGMYLGKIAYVSDTQSKIRLLTFVEEKIPVRIVDEKFASKNSLGKGLLVGIGLGKMKVEQILASETIAKGNLVKTSLNEGDLLVGEIEDVVLQNDEVFKTASVKRLFNPEQLETIFLIRGKI